MPCYHYVYYVYEQWGKGYIGVRSCSVIPEKDSYFGSYRDKKFCPTEKIILMTFSTRKEAEYAEYRLHKFFSVVENKHFANKAKNILNGFSRAGATNSVEHREKTRRANQGPLNPNYGKPRSLETRQKQSNALKNRVFSHETKRKMEKAKEKKKKPITLQSLKTKQVFKFSSLNEAARELNLNVGNISNVLNKRQRSTGGFTVLDLS